MERGCAGHAHLTSLKNLSHFKKLGHQVTLISSSPYHYYSGMGPGMLSGIYHPREVRFHVKKMTEDQGTAFIKGKAIKVDQFVVEEVHFVVGALLSQLTY